MILLFTLYVLNCNIEKLAGNNIICIFQYYNLIFHIFKMT